MIGDKSEKTLAEFMAEALVALTDGADGMTPERRARIVDLTGPMQQRVERVKATEAWFDRENGKMALARFLATVLYDPSRERMAASAELISNAPLREAVMHAYDAHEAAVRRGDDGAPRVC